MPSASCATVKFGFSDKARSVSASAALCSPNMVYVWRSQSCARRDRTRFRVATIERDCPACQCLHRAPGIRKAAHLKDRGSVHVSRGETPISSRKGGIKVDRLLEEFLR